jgi:hypothetical protein
MRTLMGVAVTVMERPLPLSSPLFVALVIMGEAPATSRVVMQDSHQLYKAEAAMTQGQEGRRVVLQGWPGWLKRWVPPCPCH